MKSILIGAALLLTNAPVAAGDAYAGAAAICAEGAAKPAGSPSEGRPISSLYMCVSPIDRVFVPQYVDFAFLGVSSCLSDIGKIQQRMRTCADERVKGAVDAAGSNADLKSAIKELYVKQQTLIDALGPTGTQSKMTYRIDLNRAVSENDQAWSKVELEAKLAGIKP